jgi:hypothetical protein
MECTLVASFVVSTKYVGPADVTAMVEDVSRRSEEVAL